jgi:hypothetical protein
MKNLIPIIFALATIISCTKDSAENSFKSKGRIGGIDMRQCVCGCGGYFINIDQCNYRFNEDSLIENSIHLSTAILPIDVYLDWELIPPELSCSNDLIKISSIKLVD